MEKWTVRNVKFNTEGFATLEEYLDYAEETYKDDFLENPGSFDKNGIDDDYKSATNALKAIKEIALYFDQYDAKRLAIRRLLNPLGLNFGNDKEKEYKAVVFSEIGIKADMYDEIQI